MDGGGLWEPGISLVAKEATDKQWGEARMNHVVLMRLRPISMNACLALNVYR